MIVGCYSLELYCDKAANDTDIHGSPQDPIHKYREFPEIFTGNRRQDCERQARKRGWLINNATGVCLCPRCSGKKKVMR